jgi:predicted nucleic acid-binding protein
MAEGKGQLVFDTSPLNHFARAGELRALRDLVTDFECVTTKAVLGELRKGADTYPAIQDALDLDWIRIVPCDELDELYLFGQYMNRLGNFERNAGEASVLAWAEAHSAAAYVDDQVACNVGRSRGVRVHRTLQLVISAFRTGRIDESSAQSLIKSLADNDARFPAAARDDLFGWARAQHPPLL